MEKYKNQIRIIKTCHAYGNFIYNCIIQRAHSRNLNDFVQCNIAPRSIVDAHARWDETVQGFDYWNNLHYLLKRKTKIFKSEDTLQYVIKFENLKKSNGSV